MATPKKQPTSGRKYTGVLARPIVLPEPPRPPGALTDSPETRAKFDEDTKAWNTQAALLRMESFPERLQALKAEYGLADDPDFWAPLAMRLAFEHVPGFQVKFPERRGRKVEWDEIRLLALFLDARDVDRGRGDLDTCRTLITRHAAYRQIRADALSDRLREARTSLLVGMAEAAVAQLGDKVWPHFRELADSKKLPEK